MVNEFGGKPERKNTAPFGPRILRMIPKISRTFLEIDLNTKIVNAHRHSMITQYIKYEHKYFLLFALDLDRNDHSAFTAILS
jgi:hypothetical protein